MAQQTVNVNMENMWNKIHFYHKNENYYPHLDFQISLPI